jgi:phage terminase large subunit-like protein
VSPLPSIGSGRSVLPCGSVTPRLFTPPLRDLAEPGASVGPLQVEFARETLRAPFDPWQEFLALHAGELLPDGRPRFWLVLVLVARQNGKTHVPVVLAPFWSLVEQVPLILGTSTKLDYAQESWEKAITLLKDASATPGDPLYGEIPAADREWLRRANGEQRWTLGRSRYKIAPANEEGGRSLTIWRLILDELRQHFDRSAWNAAVPATEAVPDAQVWALSNAGSDKSVVLNAERAAALHFIATGEGDPRVGIFEWSAPDGADPTDPEALAMANPQFGYRMDPERMLGKARSAVAEGGETLAGFRTESMCQRVKVLDPAIDPGSWARCLDPGSLADLRSRLAVVVDVAPDGGHVAAYAAAVLEDGRVRVDPAGAWDGVGCVDAAERALPAVLARVKPRVLGWFPGGPGAALAARLKDRGNRGWPPRGVRVEEIRAEVPAVCMGFEQMVVAGQVAHSGDPLLDAHVAVAERLRTGDVWRFSRKGETGHVDAVYAAAGAVHLARTMPAPRPAPRVIRSSPRS